MEIGMDLIYAEKNIDDFMHAADVFEISKRLGKHECIVVKGGDIKIHELVVNMKNALEKAGMVVTFVGINHIDGEVFNFPEPYVKEGTSCISNGRQWGLLKDLLMSIGYKVETNERMQVTKAIRHEEYRIETEPQVEQSKPVDESSPRLPFKKKKAGKRGPRL